MCKSTLIIILKWQEEEEKKYINSEDQWVWYKREKETKEVNIFFLIIGK